MWVTAYACVCAMSLSVLSYPSSESLSPSPHDPAVTLADAQSTMLFIQLLFTAVVPQVALDDADARCVPAVVLDVRPTMQFHLMHLPGALNVPEEELSERLGEVVSLCGRGADSNTDMRGKSGGACTSTGPDAASASASEAAAGGGVVPLLVICRRGNASQLAVQTLRAAGLSHAVDIIGGMQRWAADVDPSMPVL